MDKYIGITISYTGIPVTVNVKDVSTRFCNNSTSHRLIIREETLLEDTLGVFDIIAVRRHNSYEWAIITSILPKCTGVSVYMPSSGRTIMYPVLERTGRISTICSNGNGPRGLYTIVSQSKTLNNNHIETRNVSITLEQAREWYKSDNAALKTIALNAFKDWELEEKFEDIVKDITYTSLCRVVPSCDVERVSAYVDLCKLAKALNGDWVRKPKEKAWFFSGATSANGNGCKTLETRYHIESNYQALIYFKDMGTINKAGEIILREWDRFKPLFT
jgi:hypothetical protein